MDFEEKYGFTPATDGEMQGFEYTIPDGFTAEIKDGKVIVKKQESEGERIRKDIIHYILYKADGVSEEQEHSWIAYLEKQKEQKPAVEQQGGTFNSYDMAKTFAEGQYYVMKHPEKFGLCKPAEWSEDFEENIRNLLHDKLTWHSEDESMSSAVFIDYKTLKDIVNGIWFYVGKEALKYSNKELSQPEWNEEDSRILYNVIAYVGYAAGQRGVRDDLFKEANDWLKSLHPQPHWKPSEEQISALERAIVKMHTPTDVGILAELRDNLKKL